MRSFNYLLVGGGLQNGLIAAALARHRPQARVGLLERAPQVGGNHTWCFHAADIDAQTEAIVAPFVAQRWPAYDVHFPRLERRLSEAYAAVTSESFARHLCDLQAQHSLTLLCGEAAAVVEPHRVILASGTEITSDVVIDARGPGALSGVPALGYQKFLGLELEVEPSSAPTTPTLMDARVPQRGAFRFFYVLPLAANRVLVEDTYYSQSPDLDRHTLRQDVRAYAASIGLRIRAVVREEAGVLPLPEFASAKPNVEGGVLAGGYQGGFFHPTTGYSFPLAARLASVVAHAAPAELSYQLSALARREAKQQRYVTLLNRLMFRAFAPEERVYALERFYRLPAPTIRRFYALNLTQRDRARILCGRPPRGFSVRRLLGSPTYGSALRSPTGETS